MTVVTAHVKGLLLTYVVLGVALWFVPLLHLLHVESSAVVAGVAFFAAGLTSIRWFEQGGSARLVLATQLLALSVPWFLLTVTLLWIPNCGYGQGLLFYLLFAPPSVCLAVGLAYLLSRSHLRFKRGLFMVLGLAVTTLTPIFDVGLHPQFYTYNHVFGGIVGPIYDEELSIRRGLVAFRGLTLLWAALCFVGGMWIRQRRSLEGLERRRSRLVKTSMLGLAGMIVLCYVFAAPLGINTPGWYIQRELGGLLQTKHFDIYYDPASLDEDELRLLAWDHEYRYVRLAEQLSVEVPDRISSYLYPDPDTKARLTGARYTNVAPVWLARPQVHVLLDAYDVAFGHELVHVFSREFGLPLLNASLSVGLIEGLAVALEPPGELPSPDELVIVAAARRVGLRNEPRAGLAAEVATRLSPLGFWTSRGAVSYTTMGSFVRYLYEAYGPERLKRVYALANFEAVYGKSVERLVQEWQRSLAARPVVARSAEDVVFRRFTVPSLFEEVCPHYVPPYRRAYSEGAQALAEGDTARALAHVKASLAVRPTYHRALGTWANLMLERGQAERVAARLDTLAAEWMTAELALRLGDALGMLGREAAARARYREALERLPAYAHEERAVVLLHRELASEPWLLGILTSAMPFEARAARLAEENGGDPAIRILRALLLAASGEHAQAAALLEETLAPQLQDSTGRTFHALDRQRTAWLAHMYAHAGRFGRAAVSARAAAEAYAGAGDLNTAARYLDLARKMKWIQGQRGDAFDGTVGT